MRDEKEVENNFPSNVEDAHVNALFTAAHLSLLEITFLLQSRGKLMVSSGQISAVS